MVTASSYVGGIPEFSTKRDFFQTWDTWATLVGILCLLPVIMEDRLLKSPEKSLSAKWAEVSKKGREGPFLLIVDRILEALEEQVVPHSKLVEIVCEGKMEQNCTVCQKRIVVTRIWIPRGKLEVSVPASVLCSVFPTNSTVGGSFTLFMVVEG